MTTTAHDKAPPSFNDSKDVARQNWLRGHRVSQDHGTKGTYRGTERDEHWDLMSSPHRVKLAEQPVDYSEGPLESEDIYEAGYSMPMYEPGSDEDLGAFVYGDSEDERAELDDQESPEYQDAYDELVSLLDRHGIDGAERTAAIDTFRSNIDIRHMFYEQARDLSDGMFPTSYDQVDSANRMSPRALTDYYIEGDQEDDNGDYHLPHMSVRR